MKKKSTVPLSVFLSLSQPSTDKNCETLRHFCVNFISESGLTSSEDSRRKKKTRDRNTLLNMIPAFKDAMNTISAVYGSPRG